MKKFLLKNAILFASSIVLAFSSFAADLIGAGASFPAPIYIKWTVDYSKENNINVNYQSIGSGAGIQQILAKTVDFGATDIPLKEDELKDKNLLQFPTVIGAITPVVNIKGIKPGELKLTGKLLADIFLGKIKNWSDPQIKEINPNLDLPDRPITVVRRADGSGTTYIFSAYLSLVNDIWAKQVGADKVVNWPVGMGGKGNEGVASFVKRIPNSIGYVEFSYAKKTNLAYVSLQNKSGNFVQPDLDTFKAAVNDIDWKSSFTHDLNNSADPTAWPIVSTTYILINKVTNNPEKTKKIFDFFTWAFKNGDETAVALDYVTFPDQIKKLFEESFKQVVDEKGKSIY